MSVRSVYGSRAVSGYLKLIKQLKNMEMVPLLRCLCKRGFFYLGLCGKDNMGKESKKLIANNKKAYHDYFIEETYEAGISLAGTEVKSMRMGKCSIKESFLKVDNGQVYIYGMHVSPYEKGNIFNKDPLRVRKLLLHKAEINRLNGKIAEKGYTLVPLEVYLKGSLVKVEIALAKGKKLYDKREDIAKKDQRREAEREYKISKMY